MAITQITATKGEKSATINVDLGDSVADAIAKFGESVVLSNYKRTAVITAQAAIRRMLETGKDQAAISETMKSWRPGVALERSVDTTAAFLGKWENMSKEERAEILKKLKA